MIREIKSNTKYKSVTRQWARKHGTTDAVCVKPNKVLMTTAHPEIENFVSCHFLPYGVNLLVPKGQFRRLFKEVK